MTEILQRNLNKASYCGKGGGGGVDKKKSFLGGRSRRSLFLDKPRVTQTHFYPKRFENPAGAARNFQLNVFT